MSVNPTSPWDFFDASGNFLHRPLGTSDRHVLRGEAEVEPRQTGIGCIFWHEPHGRATVRVSRHLNFDRYCIPIFV